jgi:NAD-dependent dihydropyrimidine dehydrogenase PreA subunit
MAIEIIDYEKCIRCHRCYDICPMDVFRLVGEEVYLAYAGDCARCFLCERVCPTEAIGMNALPVVPLPDPFRNVTAGLTDQEPEFKSRNVL